MTMKRSARRGRSPRRRSEPTMWTTATLNEASPGPGGQQITDLLGGFTLTEKHNISGVVTIHWDLSLRATTPGQNIHGRFGMIVVEDDALAASAVPEAVTDGDAPWLLNRFWNFLSSADESKYLSGQVKARRRIGIKETLAFIFESDSTSDGSVDMAFGMRVLLQRGR